MMTDFYQKHESSKPEIYQIIIKERLDQSWAAWFENMTISIEKGKDGLPVTVLTGTIPDQAALSGILNKIWNFSLTVLSVKQI